MATIAFSDAAAVTNAMAALSAADRFRCVVHADGQGFAVEAPDDLTAALEADHPAAPLAVKPSVLEVSSAQALIMLSRAKYLQAVEASVDAIGGEVKIWFERAKTWQRTNPHVIEIGAGLNLTPAEIDDLFREAAKIDV